MYGKSELTIPISTIFAKSVGINSSNKVPTKVNVITPNISHL